MRYITKCLAIAAIAASALSAKAENPRVAFFGPDWESPQVHLASQTSRISFNRDALTVLSATGEEKAYPTDKIQKMVFDYKGIYSSVDRVTDSAPAQRVTPNPVTDWFSVEAPEPTDLSVYTITGSRVIFIPSYRGDKVNASHLVKGIYIVKTNLITAKFIKL